jgi:uncharacterized protein YbjT (DUF2867 family)
MQTKVASEQARARSGLPVVIIRPTVFLESFFLPSPVRAFGTEAVTAVPAGQDLSRAAADVARVVVAVLADPRLRTGRITSSPVRGRRTCTGTPGCTRTQGTARTHTRHPPEDWAREPTTAGQPDHLSRHLVTMAE